MTMLTTFETAARWLLSLSRLESLVEAGAELVALPLSALGIFVFGSFHLSQGTLFKGQRQDFCLWS